MSSIEPEALEFIFSQVMRLHHYRTQMLLGELGIYPGQPAIFCLLWKRDGRSQKELAKLLALKPPTVTVMLNRMEKAGWLERRPDPNDLRVSRVYLTERAKKIRPRVEEAVKAVSRECFAGFSGEEQVQMQQLLVLMRSNLGTACAKKPVRLDRSDLHDKVGRIFETILEDRPAGAAANDDRSPD